MRLTVVGCSGSFPGPDGPASCYLVEADGFRVLLDLGNGALGALQRYLPLDDVDAVLLSHLHADHCLDLCPFYVARRYHPDGPRRRIPVLAPAGAADRMARAYDLEPQPGMHGEFDFQDWQEGSRALGPFAVTVARVNHPVEAYGIRLEHAGRSLTYSGDSDDCHALSALADRTDLFLCEAAFHEGRDAVPDLHLTGRRAAQVAARAGVGRLVLTHIPPWNDRMRTLAETDGVYDGPVELAQPGASYEV
ncbi:MBL fold metallo-hydrolase [Vallicoccus soli]|uniref:MBL fold metallo-hydrolase n=1 Tax=Vallicoccus soli TaxID=2339232 RepID=A0A3A3Z8J4_9ACTN|nr:MBL fold metallo-hydrolase [Vallicoccus soli]RJK97157.1 MBL fold metallo-hydrolase [Vallicoccus soli]